jgi:hypothetical protein
MVSAIESDSEHDRGASRTPTTAQTVSRLHRSTTPAHLAVRVVASGWPAALRSEPVGPEWGQGPASTPPTNAPEIARGHASYPDPQGPDTSCRDLAVPRGLPEVNLRCRPGIPPLPTFSRGRLSPAFPRRKTDSAYPRCLPSTELNQESRGAVSPTHLSASSPASSDCL